MWSLASRHLQYCTVDSDCIFLPSPIAQVLWSSICHLFCTLKTIGHNAFDYCFSLETARLPVSRKTVGSFAFLNCVSFKDVQFKDGLEEIGGAGGNAFYC